MNKLNNTRKAGLGHALAPLKKMMSSMHSITCQVQPRIKLSPSWLQEPTHINNNKHEKGHTQNNDQYEQDPTHTKIRGA
jgi:hypothetical protein